MLRRLVCCAALLSMALSGCVGSPPAPEPSPLDELPPESRGRTGVWIEAGDFEVSEDAVFPDALPGFAGAEVLADRLVLDFGGDAPIEVGDVVAGGGLADGYMRVATATRTLDDGRQEVMTRQADLDELFDDYDLVVRGRSPEASTADGRVAVASEALTERFDWRECIGGTFPWNGTARLPGGTCGDSTCNASESVSTCPADCATGVCGNGACEDGETETSCKLDCDDGIPDWARATAPPGSAPTTCGGAPEPSNTCTTSGEVVAEVCPYVDWEPNFDFGIRPIEAYANVDTSITSGVTARAGARVMAHCSADFVRMLGMPDRLNLANFSRTWTIGCIPIGPACVPVYFGVEALVFAEPVLQGEMDFRFDAGEVEANAELAARVRAGGSVGLGGVGYELDPSITPSSSFENTRAGAVRIETGLRAGVVVRLAVGVSVSVGVPPLPTIPAALLERVGVPIPTSVSIGAGAYVQLEIIGHVNSTFENDFSGCGFRSEVPYCFEGNIAAGAYVTTPIPGLGLSIDGRYNLFSTSGVLYSNAEEFMECRMRPRTCDAGGTSCMDTVLGAEVCDGDHGFVACGDPGQAQRCLCAGGTFTECTACAAVPSTP